MSTPRPGPFSGRSGFSLVEGIGAMVVFAILMGALTFGLGGLFSQQARSQVTYNDATYSQAPSFDDFHEAIDLHTAFSTAVDEADSVIVLGGARSHPDYDPAGPSSALDTAFADTTLTASVGCDGSADFSSWDQRQANASQFDSHLTSNPDSADFTILTVQGASRITSITQQRRHRVTINGQDLSLYEVTHQEIDWSSGSPVSVPNAGTGTAPTYAYRFYYTAAEDVWAMPPGATHTWYRADADWGRDQEGPSRVIFADPYALPGQDSGSQLNPVSRFVYFIPQVR